MNAPRISADFNGIVGGATLPERKAVVLDTFGAVRDLANAGITLTQGLPLIAVDWSDEEEDMEGHGTAQYDFTYHWWVVEFDDLGIRFVPTDGRPPVLEFKCVGCRADIADYLKVPRKEGWDCVVMRTGNDGLPRAVPCCPHCKTPIDAPIQPPANHS